MEEEIKEERGITTKQLIAKLLEIDPDGNKNIFLECGDDYYSGWLKKGGIEVDNNNNAIMLYW